MKIRFGHKGDLSKTDKYLNKLKNSQKFRFLAKYGQRGVAALSAATPVDTGLTAASWFYEIVEEDGRTKLAFHNSNVQKGVNIAIILQHGHGTRNGGYVVGVDYINPALQPIFVELMKEMQKELS